MYVEKFLSMEIQIIENQASFSSFINTSIKAKFSKLLEINSGKNDIKLNFILSP